MTPIQSRVLPSVSGRDFQRTLSEAVMQLSSGRRINRAADDAAGLGISEQITAQVRAASMTVRGLNDSISKFQEIDGHLGVMSDVLLRMKELATQAANDSLSSGQVKAIYDEFAQLLSYYNAVDTQTTLNPSFDASEGFGLGEGQTIPVTVPGASAAAGPAWRPPVLVGGINWETAQTVLPEDEEYITPAGTVPWANYSSQLVLGSKFLEGNGSVSANISGVAGVTEAYFEVNLVANQEFGFYFNAGTTSFGGGITLSVVNGAGQTVSGSDSGGIHFVTPSQTGTYYVKVSSPGGVGQVNLGAYKFYPAIPDSVGDSNFDAVLMGDYRYWRDVDTGLSLIGPQIKDGVQGLSSTSSKRTITYSILSAAPAAGTLGGSASDLNGWQTMDATQAAGVRAAFAYYEKILNVDFVEVASDTGNINFAMNTQAASAGYAYSPQSLYGKTYVYLAKNQATNSSFTEGSYGWLTMIHEIGHAMGLKHPGDYNAGGGGGESPFLPAALDSKRYSAMSYNQPADIPAGVHARTMMLYDIGALQYLYGTGNNANQIFAFGDADTNTLQTLWASGDGNTLDFSSTTSATGLTINLNDGEFSSLGALANNLALAYGARIDTLRLGSGSATVTGNEHGNDIYLKDGLVTFTGGSGNDRMIFSGGNQYDLSISGGNVSGYYTFSGYDATEDAVQTGAILAATTAAVDGANSLLTLASGQAIRSHQITSGIVTFDTSDAYTGAVALGSLSDVAAVVQYLQANNIGDNTEVRFAATIDGKVNTFVFVQGQSAVNSSDYMVRLIAGDAAQAGGGASSGSTEGATETGLTTATGREVDIRVNRLAAIRTERNVVKTTLTIVFSALRSGLNSADRIGSPIDLGNFAAGSASLSTLVAAIEKNMDSVSVQRSLMGAYQNSLQAEIGALNTIATNLNSSFSRIVDTDYAVTTADLTKGQIMQQAYLSVQKVHGNAFRNLIETLLAA
jgi:flagellin-like hook-associated protein FlgL